MKKERKYTTLAALILIIITSFTLYGCNDATEKKDIKEAFLTVYLTSDYEKRYSTFMEKSDDIPDKISVEEAAKYTEEIERLTHEYYGCVRGFVTEDLYSDMLADRSLYKIDKLADDKSASIYPTGIALSEYAKNGDQTTYTFTADMRIDTAGESATGTIGGQITVQQIGDSLVISNLFLSKYEI